jgi:hypothetical protein
MEEASTSNPREVRAAVEGIERRGTPKYQITKKIEEMVPTIGLMKLKTTKSQKSMTQARMEQTASCRVNEAIRQMKTAIID